MGVKLSSAIDYQEREKWRKGIDGRKMGGREILLKKEDEGGRVQREEGRDGRREEGNTGR